MPNVERRTVSAPVDGEVKEEGYTIRSKSKSVFENLTQGGETTGHEIDHVLGAEGPDEVEYVTNIPGTGSKGKTVFKRPNRVAAAAAHANGRSGTGWDMMIVRSSGDEGSAISAAKSRLSSNARYRPVYESELEKTGVVTGGRLKELKMEVDQEYILGPKVVQEIIDPYGRREKREMRAQSSTIGVKIEVESEEYLPRAA